MCVNSILRLVVYRSEIFLGKKEDSATFFASVGFLGKEVKPLANNKGRLNSKS